jgi:hypothetical protein
VAFTLSKIDRLYRKYDVTALDADGQPAALAAVSAALIPPRTTPTALTEWTTATFDGDTATVLLAGPDASDNDGALIVPAAGADLWLRVADTPEIDAELVERISVR